MQGCLFLEGSLLKGFQLRFTVLGLLRSQDIVLLPDVISLLLDLANAVICRSDLAICLTDAEGPVTLIDFV